MRDLVLAAAVVSSLAVAACASDVVLPDDAPASVCGNGIVEAGEACDVDSPGCVDCQVAAGWTCNNNVCIQPCGDGIVGDGPNCDNPRRDTACDMTGYWVAKEKDYTCDSIFHQPQTSSNWYLYHFTQTGNDFVVDQELDCGVHVTGSATVDYTPGSAKFVLYANAMDGSGSHPARHGTSQAGDGGCDVTFDRWYEIRGAVDSFLPADFTTLPPLASLPALPAVSDPINSPDDPQGGPQGATDPDGDGFLGMAYQTTGIVTGVRDSVQRQWKQYATTTGTSVPASAVQLTMPGGFDLQEDILHVSQCGTGCGLLTTGAAPSTHPGEVTMQFIGKTLTGSRVAAIVLGVPRKDVSTDLQTCQNVQQVLPHDGTAPAGACPGN
jgi:hypothetical protein